MSLKSRALAATLLIALAGCGSNVVNPVTGKEERTVMDEASELAEGRKAHEAVIAEMGVYDNPRVQAYVNQLGQKLAQQSHRSQLKWTFTVLDSPDVNAFALPGGYVYVTRGIMAYMDSEADLAGVIGHEIGHVTARHGAQRATRQQQAGLGVLAATVLGAVLEGRGVAGAGQMASDLSQGVAAGYVAKYSREQELQADTLGAEYLSRTGYDPQNMVDVIGVLKSQERFAADLARAQGKAASTGGDWLASHPSNDQRLAEITKAAAAYKTRTGFADDGRARYLQVVDGMVFGDGRNQGVVRGRDFFHEPMGVAITAPGGFTVRNTPEAVMVVTNAGDAALVTQLVPANAGSSHDQIVANVFKPTQQRAERFTLNGLQATRYAGTRTTAQGAAANFEVTLVTGPDRRVFALLPAGRDAAAVQRARAGLREAEASFRPMTASDRNAARPWALRTVALPAGGLSELARRSPLPNAEAWLQLINGVYGGGGPALRPGQPVKTVE